MNDITLYNTAISGNCYKIRLLLSLIGLEHKQVQVDLKAGDNTTDAFMTLNPRGQVPVLVDNGMAVWDSMAILTYVAKKYADNNWFPQDESAHTQIMQWLALSENELLYGLARARAAIIFSRPFDLQQCQQEGKAGLKVIDDHLADKGWLVSANPTIADLACYPYVSLAPDGEVSLTPYPNVQRWVGRIEALPGWQPLLKD